MMNTPALPGALPGLGMDLASLTQRQAQADKAAGNLSATRQAAEEFEAMFLGQMLQPMFDTLPTEGPFSGGHAEKVYRSLMVTEYAKQIAEQGGLGIADAVHKELLRIQEASQQ